MEKLIYSAITSLDGYSSDANGNFDWAMPGAERAGLVDECGLFLTPIIVAAGTRALPGDVRVRLELLEERRFRGGMVYVRYRVTH